VTLPARADSVVLGATTAFLFVAPFAASGGLRATCLIVAALTLAATFRTRPGRVPWALVIAFAGWSLLAAASLAWSSVPRHTLEELRAETFYSALAFGVFFVAADATSNWRQWCIALAAGTGAARVASSVQQGLGVSLWRHPADGGVGPFTTHLVLVAPLLVALVCHPPWGLRRSTAAAVVGLALLLGAAWVSRDGWTTPSRIVWPALLAVFATAVVAARKAEQFTVSDLRGLKVGLALAVIAVAIAFVAAIAARSERFYPGEAGISASVERDLRPRLWWRGVEEWKQAPWLGYGLGREIRESAFLPETPPQASHPLVRHAHNMPLNIALQLGLAGLGLFFAVIWLLAREYWRALHDAALAPLGVMGLALLAGFLTKNFTDDFLHRHNAQVFWALNGMLVGFASRRPAL
jgi:O-antigen ligase